MPWIELEPGQTVEWVEKVTGKLRWNGAILEQEWIIKGIVSVGMTPIAPRWEWRPVPMAPKDET